MMVIEIWAQNAGLGHITRQLNLARALQNQRALDHAQIRFIVDQEQQLHQLVRAAGYPLIERSEPLAETSAIVMARWQTDPPDIFILDSVDYDQHPALVPLLNYPGVYSVAVIDDPAPRAVAADLVINALPGLSEAGRPASGRTTYCLGKDYFILASGFSSAHAQQREIRRECRQGFIFFGGLDGNDFTALALDALAGVPGIAWTLLVGSLYSRRERVIERLKREAPPIRLVQQVPDMVRQLMEADVALLAAGNTLVEAAATGTPTVALCQNATQHANARYFADRCGLPCLGEAGDFDAQQMRRAILELTANSTQRWTLSRALKHEIDGLGGMRVARALLEGHAAARARD
jgi:spore coat polysaccharide biosynthesis predicted glycosyltransferase SpsG